MKLFLFLFLSQLSLEVRYVNALVDTLLVLTPQSLLVVDVPVLIMELDLLHLFAT
jgi:hypothetical protein